MSKVELMDRNVHSGTLRAIVAFDDFLDLFLHSYNHLHVA